jgi:hypothetical protein
LYFVTKSEHPKSHFFKRLKTSPGKGSLLPVVALVVLGLWLLALHLVTKPTPLANLYNDLQDSKPTFGLPIYVPSALPQGFSYAHQAPNLKDQILTYYLTFDGGGRVAISDRARPKDVNFNDFYSHNLSNRALVKTNLGEFAVGTANRQTVGSLTTDKVWLIVSTPAPIDSIHFNQLLTSLKTLP